ncbi:hypothetical protein J3E71DRAFT_351996, partial [Bipolaris maydis]
MKSSIIAITLGVFVASGNAAHCWTAGSLQLGCSGNQNFANWCSPSADDPSMAKGPPNNNC